METVPIVVIEDFGGIGDRSDELGVPRQVGDLSFDWHASWPTHIRRRPTYEKFLKWLSGKEEVRGWGKLAGGAVIIEFIPIRLQMLTEKGETWITALVLQWQLNDYAANAPADAPRRL